MAANLTTKEIELTLRAKNCEKDALLQLYQLYYPAIFRHAYRLLQNEATAKDMTQEAFARAFSAIMQTKEELNFRAWIYRIATNLCFKELLQRKKQNLLDQEVGAPVLTPSGTLDPFGARRINEIGVLVQNALSRLPPRFRQILLLREIEELSYDELAQALDLKEPNVKVLLHRARARFAAFFITEQLQANPDSPIICRELKTLLVASEHDWPQIERHIETCPSCKKDEQRPTAELFALLPAIPLTKTPTALEEGSYLSGAIASSAVLAATATSKGALILGIIGVLVAGVAVVAFMTLKFLPEKNHDIKQPQPAIVLNKNDAVKIDAASSGGPMKNDSGGGISLKKNSGLPKIKIKSTRKAKSSAKTSVLPTATPDPLRHQAIDPEHP